MQKITTKCLSYTIFFNLVYEQGGSFELKLVRCLCGVNTLELSFNWLNQYGFFTDSKDFFISFKILGKLEKQYNFLLF